MRLLPRLRFLLSAPPPAVTSPPQSFSALSMEEIQQPLALVLHPKGYGTTDAWHCSGVSLT